MQAKKKGAFGALFSEKPKDYCWVAGAAGSALGATCCKF